jgi:probable F420-dependent oxidoreductase
MRAAKMAHTAVTFHPFRFGISMRTAHSRVEWDQKIRQAESLGYDIVLVPDHVVGDRLGTSPALAAAAYVTGSMRIGSFVYLNDFRHPAMLAKDVITLDILSEGRFELGIGAGWMLDEYERTGIAFDAAATRIERMAEALQIVKQLCGGGPVSRQGVHYQIDNLTVEPRCVQLPHPPVFIGSGGRRGLTLAAHEADIVGINFVMPPDPSRQAITDIGENQLKQRLGWIRHAAGDRFDALELNVLIQEVCLVPDRRRELARVSSEWGAPEPDIDESPYVAIGSAEQIADQMRRRRSEFGITYYTVFEQFMEPFAAVIQRLKD